jgi:uncharacterized membrane protein YhhN
LTSVSPKGHPPATAETRRSTSLHRLTFGRLRNFGRADAALLLLSIVCSGAYYLATPGMTPAAGRVVLKALSIAPLAVLAFRVLGPGLGPPSSGAGPRRHANLILAVALTLSCVGDVLLAIDPRRHFGHALRAFLFAHLAYILLFVRSWARPLRPGRRALILTALVLTYSLLALSWLAPGMGRHAVAATIYGAVITGMTLSTILAGFSRPFVWIGAILFMISDSLLVAAAGKTGWSAAAALIWPTYYLGQYGIAIGFLREAAGDDSHG